MGAGPTTVAVGGIEISSNEESAESMMAALAPPKPDDKQPRLLVDKGRPVTDDDADARKVSEAASELGRKGGKAAAEARKAAEKKGDAQGAGGAGDKVEAAKSGGGKDGAKAEPDEDDDQETDPAASEKLGKPRHDPKARIAQLAREKKEAEERAARAERALAEREKGGAGADKKPAPARGAGEDDSAPKLEDYPDEPGAYERFVADTARWAARQESRDQQGRHEERVRAEGRARRVADAVKSFSERTDAAAKADPTFLERTAEIAVQLRPSFLLGPDDQITAENVVADEVIKSDKSDLLMLYLSEHPDEFQRLRALRTSEDVKVEVRLIARGLDRPNAATTGASFRREPSKASPPPEPVRGTPHTAEPDLYGDIDFDTFERRKTAQGARASR